MVKKFKLTFLAAVVAVIGGISSPVLAASYYDSPAFTGGGSSGYNVDNAEAR